MIVLGIETATQVCGVALTQDGRLLCEYRSNLKNVHAGVLSGAIEKVLHDAEIQAAQLDGIAVSIGPGSFTGLRIGLATAKGIAFAAGCAVMAVPTLTALAHQAPISQGSICPLIRSRAGEVYAALYHRTDARDRLLRDVTVMPTADLVDFIPQNTMLIGRSEVMDETTSLPAGCVWARSDFGLLSGSTIARLGTERLRNGETEDIRLLEPMYLQEFVTGQPKKMV